LAGVWKFEILNLESDFLLLPHLLQGLFQLL
jgi:hypothetical protein